MYIPAYASWNYPKQWQDNQGEVIQPVEKTKRFSGEVIVLISEKTYSAAEDFTSAFKSANLGILIGRPTAGTTGNPVGFALPGMGGFQVCAKKDYLSNGEEFVGYGIRPDVFIPYSLDEKLLVKKALEIFKK